MSGIDLSKLADEDRAGIRRIMSGEADEDRIRRGDVHEAIRSLRTNPVPSSEYQRALGDVGRLVSRLTTPAPDKLDAATIERCAEFVTDGYQCRSCGAVFLGREGHPEDGCQYHNWDALTDEGKAAAIRNLANGEQQHGGKGA